MTDEDARRVTLELLAARAPEATVCPSEVARALVAATGNEGAAETWRRAMPVVHAAVDGLLVDARVRLSWKGVSLAARSGPYRITLVRGTDPNSERLRHD